MTSRTSLNSIAEDIIIDAARQAHEANRAYCAWLGDSSQLPWAEAPEWQRASAIAGVKFVLDNPDAGPASSHESWLKQKTEEGWRFDPIKDAGAKTHPCVCPYEDLPVAQRIKDYIFMFTVRGFFAK